MRLKKRHFAVILYFTLILTVAIVLKSRVDSERKTAYAEAEAYTGGFSDEVTDLIILTSGTMNDAFVLSERVIVPSVDFAASVDVSTGGFVREHGTVEWLVWDRGEDTDFRFEPGANTIYHISCRKNITEDDRYILLRIYDDEMTDIRLEELAEEFAEPVVIEDDDIGEFTLDRKASKFIGNMYSYDCRASLDTDEMYGDTAEKAFGYLKRFSENSYGINERITDQIADKFIKTANDWASQGDNENDGNISHDDLRESLYPDEITVSADGEIKIYYCDARDIFEGHRIEIITDTEGMVKHFDFVG